MKKIEKNENLKIRNISNPLVDSRFISTEFSNKEIVTMKSPIRTIVKTLGQEKDKTALMQNPPLELTITMPGDKTAAKVPISISVCYGKTQDHTRKINGKLQCYHYALPNHRVRNGEVMDIPLVDTNIEWIREVTRKIAVLTCKKYIQPCYVAWSSMKPSGEQITMDQLFILGKCMDLIKSSLKEMN